MLVWDHPAEGEHCFWKWESYEMCDERHNATSVSCICHSIAIWYFHFHSRLNILMSSTFWACQDIQQQRVNIEIFLVFVYVYFLWAKGHYPNDVHAAVRNYWLHDLFIMQTSNMWMKKNNGEDASGNCQITERFLAVILNNLQ